MECDINKVEWGDMPVLAQNFIKACMQETADDRLTPENALNDAWLQSTVRQYKTLTG